MSKWIALTGLDRQLYLLDTTEGLLRQLTSQLNVCRYDWSPDGRYLACLVLDQTKGTFSYTLFLFETDGTRLHVWTEERTRIIWNWSPDGRKLAFTCGEGGDQHGKLFLMDFESGKVRQMAKEVAYAVWSHETNDLAFLWSYDDQNIFMMDANGTHRRLLFHGDFGIGQRHGSLSKLMNWSPDGRWFAFHVHDRIPRDRGYQVNRHFQVIDTHGKLIFRKDWEALHFSWSPDSYRLACIVPQANLDAKAEQGQRFNGELSVCVLERDGLAMHVLGPTVFQPSNAVAWSPNSQKIAFAGYANFQDGQYALGIGDANGQNLRYYPEVTQNREEWSPPHALFWSPDSQQVAYTRGSLRVVGVNETTPHAFRGDEKLEHFFVDGVPAWQPQCTNAVDSCSVTSSKT